MAFRYQKVKGAENRVFANARNLGNGIVESDEPLESIYLTPIEEQPTTPPAASPATPAAAPQNPPQTITANQASPQSNEQPTGKEAAN